MCQQADGAGPCCPVSGATHLSDTHTHVGRAASLLSSGTRLGRHDLQHRHAHLSRYPCDSEVAGATVLELQPIRSAEDGMCTGAPPEMSRPGILKKTAFEPSVNKESDGYHGRIVL